MENLNNYRKQRKNTTDACPPQVEKHVILLRFFLHFMLYICNYCLDTRTIRVKNCWASFYKGERNKKKIHEEKDTEDRRISFSSKAESRIIVLSFSENFFSRNFTILSTMLAIYN